MATAADVPDVYDVVINGQGYILAPEQAVSGIYGYTPTFLERTNVSGNYGDNQQDFFLTASQNSWDLGEAQRYFRAADEDRVRRFWSGTNIDPVSVPGQVTIRNTVGTLTFASAVSATAEATGGIYTVSSTNLYLVNSSGSIVDKGTHGVGATPSKWGLATDSINAYISTTSSGSVGVRKWNGTAFSTFSASPADSLAFLNNTLFGYRNDTGDLVSYNSGGTLTSLFTWKDAAGAALTGSAYASRLKPYGGKLMILRQLGFRSGELWVYDGTGVSKLADFPANFVATDVEIVAGIACVSGYVNRNSDVLPAIFYYVNGTAGQLWRSQTAGWTYQTGPAMAAYGEGIAFTDDSTGKILQYNIETGGVHTIGSYTATNATPMMSANNSILLHTRNSTTGYYFPTTTVASTATVVTSLLDFDNSLTKQFRGVKVDFDAPTGSTVDIAYQTDSVDGSFTTLKTGATSGTEYTLAGVSGRSIALKITLNKGSSATGPVLKRTYVRAAPVQAAFRKARYLIQMSGVDGVGNVELRNGMLHTLGGMEQAANINVAATSTSPVSITDRLGTFNGVVDPNGFELRELRPGEFVALVSVREV